MNNNHGRTLVESLILVMTIGIMGGSLGFAYSGWLGRYNVEKQTNEIYSDLMTARMLAMNRNRTHFVDFSGATTYRIVEDTDENSDMNVAAGDTVLYPKTVEKDNNANGYGIPVTFKFNSRGTISPQRTLWISHATDPDYDCIVISATRINMGRMKGTSCLQK